MSKDDPIDPYFIGSELFTEEELAELTKLFQTMGIKDDPNPNHRGPEPVDYGEDFDYPPVVSWRRHEWVATLLLTSTVYTCKLCGAKKEDAKGEYCYEK